jgi:HPt (histidine-containing phosphotransfer) domain-containing protein
MELPSYANIDAEDMAAKIGLNVKHIPILVQSFLDEGATIMTQMTAAINDNDYEKISLTAHSIKGSAGNLKFDAIYELAKEIELSAKDAKDAYPYAEACESLKKAIDSISL